jgi:alpha-amylase
MATNDIIFQAFKWDATYGGKIGQWYEHLLTKINDLVSCGYTLIWMPPPSKSRKQDFMGYTVMDYYDLGEHRQWYLDWSDKEKKLIWFQHDAESSLGQKYRGTETLWGHKISLVKFINECDAKGIKCIADIVINHRDPQQVNSADEWISWGGEEHTIESNKMVWGKRGTIDDLNPQEIDYKIGGAGIDDGEGGFSVNIAHTNDKAKKDIKDWLLWMKNEIGFKGWRYDFVKGFAAFHIGEYNYHTGNPFSVVEYRDSETQKIYNYIDGTDGYDVNKKSYAFDFPLQIHLKEIFWGGKPFHQLGLWKYSNVSITGGWPAKSVTFLENHDTARKGYEDFPRDEKRLIQGHVFLLTHPGIPCIFWSHYFDVNIKVHDSIKTLCQFRLKNNITNISDVEVIQSTISSYVAKIDNRILVKIGDDFWSPYGINGYWNLELSGDGWAIWKKN